MILLASESASELFPYPIGSRNQGNSQEIKETLDAWYASLWALTAFMGVR
jgi:hypothetical protein